jgi:UDP-N-acetylmuramate--alanine ligase
MMDAVLAAADVEALVLAGGRLPSTQQNLRLSTKRAIAVAELDESDGSLLRYAPTITVLSNVELDHADHYDEGLKTLMATFQRYFQNLCHSAPSLVPPLVILNANCPLSIMLAEYIPSSVQVAWVYRPQQADAPLLTPWMQARGAVYTLTQLEAGRYGATRGLLSLNGEPLGTLEAGVPGEHNCWNAAQVAVVALHLQQSLTHLSFEHIQAGLASFTGMGRRFERITTHSSSAVLIDDYGHHPTEVQVTLAAARQYMQSLGLSGKLKLWFQPHRYSRLKALWNEFLQCFDAADELYLVDVYAAHEPVIEGITSHTLQQALQERGLQCHSVGSVAEAQHWLAKHPDSLAEGDCVLSMGAGDITRLFRS